MSDVWVGIVNRFVEKLFNVKGGPTIVDIEPSIRAVLPLQNGVENRYLQGWSRFGAAQSVPAAAGLASVVRFRNPANSNIIAVLESILVGGAQDQPFATWGATVTDLANLTSLTFSRIDPRGQPQPNSIISWTQLAFGANFQEMFYGTNQTVNFVPTINCEYVVLPGQIWQVQSNVLNQALNVSLLWRERVMETSELT